MKRSVSPEKKHTQPADHCGKYTYKYNKQFKQTIKSITQLCKQIK